MTYGIAGVIAVGIVTAFVLGWICGEAFTNYVRKECHHRDVQMNQDGELTCRRCGTEF